MKKQYFSPEISTDPMELEGFIATSIQGVEGTNNPIEVGGEAEGGSTSDGRLFGGWSDED